MKHLSILGSTGSIGRNVLAIVEMFPRHFCVDALAAKKNITLLAEQIEQFDPEIVAVFDNASMQALKNRLPATKRVEIVSGEAGYCAAASAQQADVTVVAVVGAAGLAPTIAAIEAGKTIALATKETLVMAGDIVIQKAAAAGVDIRPIDSEHSAIFQCLEGHRKEDVDKILLTASGGPFLDRRANTFADIRVEEALLHPNWKMGNKITIDSATLMNKGLEVLEAKHLFGLPHGNIEVIIHPQSIIHSMVAYKDGSILAQLSIPDMKGAIAYALSYPQRLPLKQPYPDFSGATSLTFQQPDMEKFPCLALAYAAGEAGGTLPAVLNAANEIAVNAFLERKISFVEIPKAIKAAMDNHRIILDPGITDILAADAWARQYAEQLIE